MYILKRILILLHICSTFLYKNFVKLLLLCENPSSSIRQFVAIAFQKLQYQSQTHHENFVPKTLFDVLMKQT